MMNSIQIVILAAGQGTRMKSDIPKVLHSLGGRPVVYYALDLATQMNSQKTILVVSPSLKDIQTPFFHETVIQHPAQGTGDAVKWALPHLTEEGHVLVLFGDTPLIQKETLDKMVDLSTQDPTLAVIVLGMTPLDQQNYARLLLNDEGDLEQIIEHKDLTPDQKKIPLCNSGVMMIRGDLIKSFLAEVKPENAAHEYYLTDLVKIAREKRYKCGVVQGDAAEFMGINTRQDLAQAEEQLQDRWRKKAMSEGVTLRDPQSIYFSYDTKVSSDVTLHPNIVFGEGVVVEKGAEILSFCRLSDTRVGPQANVGPFAHLRGGVCLGKKAEIGNFVEVKKSTFGFKAKAKHLSYIGDAEIGARANIGAGTITCNYDGFQKYKTQVGEGVLIGSNSSLIAPLSIGDYAIVGAGSVVTRNVENRSLALTRSDQVNLEKGADKFRDKRQKVKEN